LAQCIEQPANNFGRSDVAIVGGGPAGLATAIALRREGLAVVVLERTNYRSVRVGEHIPPNTKQLLASLGLADELTSGRHASCPGICSVWGSDEPAARDYLFHPHGEGLNLSRPDFDLSLATLAQQLGAVVVTGARVSSLSHLAGSWHLNIQHGRTVSEVRATVLIDATGRAAAISKRLGARPVVYDELIGIFGRTRSGVSHSNVVLIEALPHGWWYSAGLTDGSVIATVLSDPDLIDTSQAGRLSAWREQLREARMTRERIAHADHLDLHVRTARTQRLDRSTGAGWLAVGDAALSFDPLSSEGISKGLEWGKRAALVAAALCRGDSSEQQAYEREIDETFSEYLITRYRYYAAETRWSQRPFWQRRQLPPKPIRSNKAAY